MIADLLSNQQKDEQVLAPRQGEVPSAVATLLQQPSTTPAPAKPEYKGPTGAFGLKGTLRDVIGTIGDALLVGSGRKAMYAPQRAKEKQQEQLAQAGANFSNDPHGTVADLRRRGLFKEANALEKSLREKTAANYKIQLDQRKEARDFAKDSRDQQEDALDIGKKARVIGGSMVSRMNADNYGAAKGAYDSYFKNMNISPPFKLPETYNQAALEGFMKASTDVKDQYANEFRDRAAKNASQRTQNQAQAIANAKEAADARVAASRESTRTRAEIAEANRKAADARQKARLDAKGKSTKPKAPSYEVGQPAIFPGGVRKYYQGKGKGWSENKP